MEVHQTSPFDRQSQVFRGIRFVLLGFDPIKKSQVSRKLVNGGGVDAGQYGPNCTHVIVDKLVYDDPLCHAARQDGKILVSSLWVDHSFDVGAPVDTTSVMYIPVRDLNGIPGAKSLLICLTGYQREDREDIMTMVELMGAQFSKPLIANKVTHLICYKFEGEKYLLAKKVKRIKLINHKWLEDCLKAWEIVPEADYSKSGYELEMEAEARDSEDEPEGVTTRQTEEITASPHHSLLSKQEIPKAVSNTSSFNLFSNTQETVQVTMKTMADQLPNPDGVTSEPSNHYGRTVSRSSAQNLIPASTSANKSTPQSEAKTAISASYSMKDPVKNTPIKVDMNSNTSSAKRLNKLNLSDAFNTPSKVISYNDFAFSLELKQNEASSNKTKTDDVVKSALQELKKDPPIETSPARNPPSNISGRMSLGSKGKNVICDMPISKTSTSEIEERPPKENKETNLSARSNNVVVSIAENVKQSPSAVGSDLQKSSSLNVGINEQSGGSNSKSVRKKSISKKFLAPKLSNKNAVSQKGSIFSKATDPGISDENMFEYQQPEKVSSGSKSGTEIQIGVTGNMSENKFPCTDDETEPPDEKDEASKEKHEDGEPENTVAVVMEEKAEAGDDVDPNNDISNDEDTAPVTDKTPVKKKELVIGDKKYRKLDNREEATPSRAKRARRNVNEVEKSMELKRADGVCNDPENNSDKDDDGVADVDTENVKNKKETKRNVHPLSKSKKNTSKRIVTDSKRADGVCNDPENNSDKDDDVVADVDTENVKNKKETKRDVHPLSKSKKNTSKRIVTDSKRAEGVCNESEHNSDKDDDVVADVDTENVKNKKETKRDVHPLSKSKKNTSKRIVTDSKRAEGVCNEPEHNSDKKDDNVDADMDIVNVVNKKEVKRKTRPLSKSKEGVSKRTATDSEKPMEVKSAEGVGIDPERKNEETDKGGADKDADMDTENVKETKRNKRPLNKTKKDDAKAVNKNGKPTFDLEAQKESIQNHADNQSTGSKRVSKCAKEVSKKHTNKANSDVLKDEPKWFILTGHRFQRREFQQILRRLKGRVCRVAHTWSYQATHFIVPDPIKRTEKFFAAAASGRWILKTDYLSACNEAGKFVAEEPYEWHKNGLSEDGQINLEAPRGWRLLKERTGHGAFYGMKIVIYGECIAPTLDTLKRAVKAGDGTILATSPPYTRFLTSGIDFAVVSPGMPPVDVWVQEFGKHEIPCVTADYLVEYVCKPGYSLERHVQFGTNVWADRSLNRLQNRLEEEISEPRTPDSSDVACEVCGARDRGDEMLICGDEDGLAGCGVGTHFDCCDPPLEGVPEEDWFCSKCSKKSKSKKGSKKKGSTSRNK